MATRKFWNGTEWVELGGGGGSDRLLDITTAVKPAINTDVTEVVRINAQQENIESMSDNLTGSPSDGDQLLVRINAVDGDEWGLFAKVGDDTLIASPQIGRGVYVDGTYYLFSGGLLFTSTDGRSWTYHYIPNYINWTARIAYGNGRFVACMEWSNSVLWSDDGINWNTAPIGDMYSGFWSDIIYGDGRFVMVERNMSGKLAYSDDGINWQLVDVPQYEYLNIAYGNGTFVVSCLSWNNIPAIYSVDGGVTWTEADGIVDENDNPIEQTWWGVAYGAGRFVLVSLDTHSKASATSVDGVSWQLTDNVPSSYWSNIAYGDGLFVVTTESPEIGLPSAMYSSDGLNWTPDYDSELRPRTNIFFGGDRFIAGVNSDRYPLDILEQDAIRVNWGNKYFNQNLPSVISSKARATIVDLTYNATTGLWEVTS